MCLDIFSLQFNEKYSLVMETGDSFLCWCTFLVTPNRGSWTIKYVSFPIHSCGVFHWEMSCSDFLPSSFWFSCSPLMQNENILVFSLAFSFNNFPSHSNSDCVYSSRWQNQAGLWRCVDCPQTSRITHWKTSYWFTSLEKAMEEGK